jgi:hypothetical protein
MIVVCSRIQDAGQRAQRWQRLPSRSKMGNRDIVQGSAVAIRDNFEGSPRREESRWNRCSSCFAANADGQWRVRVGNMHFSPHVYESHTVRGGLHAARKT